MKPTVQIAAVAIATACVAFAITWIALPPRQAAAPVAEPVPEETSAQEASEQAGSSPNAEQDVAAATETERAPEPVRAPPPTPPPDRREERARDAVQRWIDAYNRGDLEGYVGVLADSMRCSAGSRSGGAIAYRQSPSSQFRLADRTLTVHGMSVRFEGAEALVEVRLTSSRPTRHSYYRNVGLRLAEGRDGDYEIVWYVRTQDTTRFVPLPHDWPYRCFD